MAPSTAEQPSAEQPSAEQPSAEHPSASVALELSLEGDAKTLDALRFKARYRSKHAVRLFHRMISDRYPDELQVVFTDARGRETVVDRIAMGLPIASRVVEGDFISVSPDAPVEFTFPLWSPPKLERGEYTIHVRHVGKIGSYVTDDGRPVDAGAYTDPIVSNRVVYRHE